MVKRDMPADVLHGFLKAIQDSIIEPLKRNQTKISFQRELRDSKRFQDTEIKIKEYEELYNKFKDAFALRDKVLDVLRKFHATRAATRMTLFLDKKPEMTLQECEELKEAIGPYLALLKPFDEIRRMQTTLMSQGKIKKMTLPYEEITLTLNQAGTLANSMPVTLMEGICDISENLDQVA